MSLQSKVILRDFDIDRIIRGEKLDYENVMKYAPYQDQPDFPKLENLEVRISNYQVNFSFPYFTTYCKMIQQPDYAKLDLSIVPDGKIVEMKSLKLYLQGYRNMDIYQEEASMCVFIDVVRCCKPMWAAMVAEWDPRGSMGTRVEVEYHSEKYIKENGELTISGAEAIKPFLHGE